MENKEYKVPKEIQEVFAEVTALTDLRDLYVKRPFGFKTAKKCTIERGKAYAKAWEMVYDIWPELRKTDDASYSARTNTITRMNNE